MLTIQKLGHEFLVSTPADQQFSPIVVGLSDGRAVALYSEGDAGWLTGASQTEGVGQFIGSNGGRLGAGIAVLPPGDTRATDATALADGGFVVTWTRFQGSGDLFPDTVFRAFGADGKPLADEVVHLDHLSKVLALPDGNLLRVWMHEDIWAVPRPSEVKAQIMQVDGTPVGDEISVSGVQFGFVHDFTAKVLEGGSFVVSWTLTPANSDDPMVTYGRAFDAEGEAASGPFEMFVAASDGLGGWEATIQRLELHVSTEGGFSAVWTPPGTFDDSNPFDTGSGDIGLRVQAYDLLGVPVGPERSILVGESDSHYGVRITDLADGTYLVTNRKATTSNPDAPGWQLSAQVFDADWNVVSDEILLGPTSGYSTYSVAQLADGKVLVSWESTDLAAPAYNTSDVSARVLSISDLGGVAPVAGALTVMVADASPVTEKPGGVWAAFEVTLSRDSDAPVSVAFATVDGTALAGSDYDAASGTLTFLAGETRKSVWVRVNDDLRSEGDETISLRISNATGGATIADASGELVIRDNEPAPFLASVSDAAPVLEGNSGYAFANFTVTLDRASDAPITLGYHTLDGTAASAGAGADYIFSSGAITFAAGETSKVVAVGVRGDTTVEGNETFSLVLGQAPDNVWLARAQATATIVNDDLPPPPPPPIDVDGDPLFDTSYYLEKYRDVAAAGVDARSHYMSWGWKEGRDPNAVFDTDAYLAANRDVAAAGVNPLDHYRMSGVHEGRDVSLSFDGGLYLAANRDVAAAGLDPLLHYLANGMAEGRKTFDAVGNLTEGGFDAQFYLMSNRDVAASGMDAETHFRLYGASEGRNPNGVFDAKGYLEHYGDVAAAGMNPLDHFMQWGWKEGRDGAADFDTSGYLAANQDVAAAGVNPLTHWMLYGQAEGRVALDDGMWS